MANGLQTNQVNTILNAATATGPGSAFAVPSASPGYRGFIQTMAWQINTTGSPSGLSATLQGSLDGVNWFNIGSAVTTAILTVVNLSNANAGPYAFIRANLGTLTGGTTPTVTVLLSLGAI
jgi:hypothetical protein